MRVSELLFEGSEEDKLEAWKDKVKKAYPEHATKMKFKGRQEGGKDMVCAEVPGMDRCFGVFDMDTLKGQILGEDLNEAFAIKLVNAQMVMEKRPAGAPSWKDSDAPDANGKFKELGINDLADWLIRTRGGNSQKIHGSINQQIVFNRNKNPSYAKKMERVREAVKRKLAARKKD